MTPQRAKELLPIIQAFAEGKTIQFKSKYADENTWSNIDDPSFGDTYEYRIKPEPKFRPWKPEEVPVGALIRNKLTGQEFIIMGRKGIHENSVEISRINTVRGGWQSYSTIDCEHSLDHGKTWLPCGVLE